MPGAEPRCTADPGWERACSRKRLICHINAGCAAVIASKLGSHRVLCLAQSFGARQIQGGSGLARDSGLSVGIDVGCAAVIASKLGSHRVLCLAQSLGARQIQGGSGLARDSGLSVGIDVGCAAVIASRLAPTGFCAWRRASVRGRSRVGASLLAIAVYLSHRYWMCRRHREQARLPQDFVPGAEPRCAADPGWERACSR